MKCCGTDRQTDRQHWALDGEIMHRLNYSIQKCRSSGNRKPSTLQVTTFTSSCSGMCRIVHQNCTCELAQEGRRKPKSAARRKTKGWTMNLKCKKFLSLIMILLTKTLTFND